MGELLDCSVIATMSVQCAFNMQDCNRLEHTGETYKFYVVGGLKVI